MVPTWVCIHDMLKVKVKVKGHVIRTLLWVHKNRFFSQANGWNTTKVEVAHDYHPRCAQGQGRGKRSRDTGTSVISRNVWYTVPSNVLSLHALTFRSTITLSFQCKCQSARRNVYIIPPSRFYFRLSFSWIVGCSSIIETSIQGSYQRQPCCHRAVMVVQERCCALLFTPEGASWCLRCCASSA